MLSHLHLIISAKNVNDSLSSFLRDFKKAGHKLKRIKSNKLWKYGNHPIELDTNEILQQKLDYIHQNPVESEIVEDVTDYKYSSTKEYAGIRKGFLDLELVI